MRSARLRIALLFLRQLFEPLFMKAREPLDCFGIRLGQIPGFGDILGHVAQEIFDLRDLSAFVIRSWAVVHKFPVALAYRLMFAHTFVTFIFSSP